MAQRVAVVGAGPGGLVSARWLVGQGFEPVLFEQAPVFGGQWTGLQGFSGVWPGMHTNTSRILTAFSDLANDGAQTFLPNADVLAYLQRYAAEFDLDRRIRLSTRVTEIRQCGSQWVITHSGTAEVFDKVVVASGRFQSPVLPAVPGLDTFAGAGGVIPTCHFRGADAYRGSRVLVAGCAVSALEIASELAQSGAARVVVTQRRQRYVLPKFAAGVPSDHRMFTRYGVLADETLPPAEVDRQLREIVVEAGGSPEQYGAPSPGPSLFAAGVTLSQHYLPLVAEGRIAIRPWPESVSGNEVAFGDGRTEAFDAIVFGTGFALDLPFLSASVAATVDLDDAHLDADRHTFHPDLPGLAFVGMWEQSGGYFVPLELQARWIAYTWGGVIPTPDRSEQTAAIEAYRARRGLPQKSRMNLVAQAFARAAGCEPSIDNWPGLRRALLFGPLAPSCYRLEGPDALPAAAQTFARDAAAFGAITSDEFTPREQAYWDRLRTARG